MDANPCANPQGEKEEAGLTELRELARACKTENGTARDIIAEAMLHAAPHEGETELLLRFLRARACNAKKALAMMEEDLVWREEKNILTLRTLDPETVLGMSVEELEATYNHGFLGYDRFNRPIVYKHYGNFHLPTLCKSTSIDHLINYDEWMVEKCIECLGPNVQSFVGIIDLSGLGMRLINSKGMAYCRGLANGGAAHYPERLGSMYIINSPWIFRGPFNMIKGWLDPRTQAKLNVIGDAKMFLPLMEEIMDTSLLPESLGGTAILEGCRSFTKPHQPQSAEKGVEEKESKGEVAKVAKIVLDM